MMGGGEMVCFDLWLVMVHHRSWLWLLSQWHRHWWVPSNHMFHILHVEGSGGFIRMSRLAAWDKESINNWWLPLHSYRRLRALIVFYKREKDAVTQQRNKAVALRRNNVAEFTTTLYLARANAFKLFFNGINKCFGHEILRRERTGKKPRNNT